MEHLSDYGVYTLFFYAPQIAGSANKNAPLTASPIHHCPTISLVTLFSALCLAAQSSLGKSLIDRSDGLTPSPARVASV